MMRVVVDGQAGAAYDMIEAPQGPTFSPDGKHVACVADTDAKSLVGVDGQVVATYELNFSKPGGEVQ